MPFTALSPLRNSLLDLIGADQTLLFLEGLDAAAVGIAEIEDVAMVVYDYTKIIGILRKRDGMTLEDAQEFFAYNIERTRSGESFPVFLHRIPSKVRG